MSVSSNYYPYHSSKKPNDHEDDDQTFLHSASSSSSNNLNITPHQEGSSDSVMMMLIKKVGLGFVGAAHACIVLVVVAAVAVSVGVGLVRFWLEEPIFLKEKLHFDYTQIHPSAVYSFSSNPNTRVPTGHTFQVSVALLMPESQYNRQLGIFQLRAEIVGENGEVMGRSSEACMLRFRSLPIRMMRVLVLGMPILLGMSNEAQKVQVVMLRHKEKSSDSIRVTLIPRAGTVSLPQVYEAHIFVQSHLPFFKRILYRWKWTMYVWASMNIFMMMLVIMLCFCKPSLILCGPRSFFLQQQLWRRTRNRNDDDDEQVAVDHIKSRSSEYYDQSGGGGGEYNYNEYPLPSRSRRQIGIRRQVVGRDDDNYNNVDDDEAEEEAEEVSELLLRLRLQRSRSKRKAAAAALLFNSSHQHPPAASSASSCASSTITTVQQQGEKNVDDDSESVNNYYQCNVA